MQIPVVLRHYYECVFSSGQLKFLRQCYSEDKKRLRAANSKTKKKKKNFSRLGIILFKNEGPTTGRGGTNVISLGADGLKKPGGSSGDSDN